MSKNKNALRAERELEDLGQKDNDISLEKLILKISITSAAGEAK